MSREKADVTGKTEGLSRKEPAAQSSSAGDDATGATVYRGWRDPGASVGEECTVAADGTELEKRYDLLSASPSGFEWGYRGSGPAQLAIAMLSDAYGDQFACDNYQRFKDEVIAALPEHGWTLTTEDIDEWREVSIDGQD